MSRLKINTLLVGAILVVFAAGCAAPAAPSPTTPVAGVPVTAPTLPVPTSTQAAAPASASTAANSPAVSATQPANSESASGGAVYTIVADKTEARYRVREQLANRDLPSDAIGKTNAVSGSIIVKQDGSLDPSSKITVDVSTLATDQAMRDNYVRRNILQTSQYPTATFVPTAVTGLPSPLPASGPVKFQITGDLTIKDVTKPVTWDVAGTVNNGVASGTATTSFKFEDFNITQPRVPVVLSVEDNITLEVDLTVQKK